MQAITRRTQHRLTCHLHRCITTDSSDFFKTFSRNQQYEKSRADTLERLEDKSSDHKYQKHPSRDQTSESSPTSSSSPSTPISWVTASRLKGESHQQSASAVPGGQTYTKPRSQRQQQIMEQTERQYAEYQADTPRRAPIGSRYTPSKPKEFDGNKNIRLTLNNSADGGKKDVFFRGDHGDRNYQREYTNFLIEQGFVEEEDINEQYEWLQESYKLQYDPDDSDGIRLPPQHEGRNKDEWTENELYFGKHFKKEKLEFNHFNKSFILDSCPPFPDRMVHHEPTENNQAPLYLPHVSQNIPSWTLRKKIAKTYGPGYMSQITMPPMKLPEEDDFQAMLKQFINEKKYKKYAVDKIQEIEQEFDGNNLYRHMDSQRYHQEVDTKEFVEENKDRLKWLGTGSPFEDKMDDTICREYEIWDKDLCYELKHDGDPSIPQTFKDEIFRQYVTSIDRNGSMAPWQKNYAFSLLPKAFGGPQGDYIDTILMRMKPKAEKVHYELKKYGEDMDMDTEDVKGKESKEAKRKRRAEMRKSRASDLMAKIDVTGLGL